MRRGVLLVIPAFLLAAASTYPQPTTTKVVSRPTRALADYAPLPALQQEIRPVVTPPGPVPRVVLGAQTTRLLVALTFDLDMTPGMAAAARAGLSGSTPMGQAIWSR